MLSRSLNCCRRASSCFSSRSSTGQELQGSSANPLHSSIPVTSALGQQLEEWQEAISEFEEAEIIFREKFGEIDRSALLAEISTVPISSPSPLALSSPVAAETTITAAATSQNEREQMIYDLAERWHKVQQCELRLPISPDKNDMDNNAHGKRTSQSEEVESTTMFGFFSKQLSSTWTKRLNAINPTEGAVFITTNSSRTTAESSVSEEGLKIRPRWPRDLGDISYEVIKVNKFGGRMNRILKLTQYHVVSIKDGMQVTKFYEYGDIRRAFIAQKSEGPTLKVIQRSGKVNTYVSPQAVHIFQQVVTRVRVRRALDNSNDFFAGLNSNNLDQRKESNGDLSNTNSACGFTMQFTVEVIRQISEANASAADDVMATFAVDLRQRTMRSLVASEESGRNSVEEEAKVAPAEDSQSSERSEGELAKSRPSSCASPKGPRMREVYNENSPEAAVYQQARTVLFDQTNAEASTIAHFITTFDPQPNQLSAALLQIRHFIDGLHEYCLGSRAFSLAVLLQQRQQQAKFQESAKVDAALGHTSTMNPVLQSMKQPPLQNKRNQLMRRDSLKFLKEQNLGPQQLDDDTLTLLSLVIFLAVEECVFLSVRPMLIKAYQAEHAAEEQRLLQCMQGFAYRSQVEWGVPSELVSPLGWKAAIFELSGLENDLTPSAQLQVLSRTVKSIYHEFKLAVLPSLQKEVFLAADDLVPIFLYIFCQLRNGVLTHPLQNRDFMWGLCHPDQLRGEAGYYLTLYESAIEFVLNEPQASPDKVVESLQMQEQLLQMQQASRALSTDSRSNRSGSLARMLRLSHTEEGLRESFM